MITLASAYQDGEHPRLFLGPDELPAFRERAQSGIGAEAMAEMLSRCDAFCNPDSDRYVDPDSDRLALIGRGNWGSSLNDVIHCLSFVASVIEDERWLEPCLRMLRTIASDEPAATSWAKPFGYTYDRPEPICISALNGHFPLAVDMLWPQLSDNDRALFADYLRDAIVDPYRDTMLADRRKYAMGIGINPMWHEFYSFAWSLGVIAEADRPDDVAALELVASLVRRAIHMGVDDAGTIGESVGYGLHDTFRWTTCAEMLSRAGVCDLWDEEPQFGQMLSRWAYLLLPGRGEFINRGDATGSCGCTPLWSQAIHARHTGDTVAQWVFEELGGRDLVAGRKQRVDMGSPGWRLLWDRDDAKAERPNSVGWPMARTGGWFGENVFRSGWGDEDLACSLLAAGRQPGCYVHQHADAGHLSLHALGEAFSIDTGYGDNGAGYHSVMMPGGAEPATVGGGFDTAWEGGHVRATATTSTADYACVDTAWQWRSAWNYRHMLVVRGPGLSPYVLLFENINQTNDYGLFDWVMNTHPDNRVALSDDPNRAIIHGRQHRLEVLWAHPRAEDYPKPHWLEPRTDMIDSYPFGPQPDGSIRRLGKGIRPRLINRLWGYNGMLLSALVPRPDDDAPLSVEPLSGCHQFGWTINHGSVRDTIVCSSVDRWLDVAGLSGEATLTVVRRDADGEVIWWAAADAASLSIDGESVLVPDGGLKTLTTG